MARSTPVVLSALALLTGACASYVDKPYQRIHVSTPGAKDAECILEAGKSKAIALPPQKVTIRNNNKPLKVTCQAPGNRVRHVSYQPAQVESAKYNIANGYAPGMYYDYVERSLYTYPERIVVDFKGVEERPNPLPQYQYSTAPSPNKAGIEYFGPGRSLLSQEEKQASSDSQSTSDNKSEGKDAGVSVPTPLPGKKDKQSAQSFEQGAKEKASSNSSQPDAQESMPQQSSSATESATQSATQSGDGGDGNGKATIPARVPEQTQSSPSSSSAQGNGGSAPSSFEERARQQGRKANQAQPEAGDSASNTPTQLY